MYMYNTGSWDQCTNTMWRGTTQFKMKNSPKYTILYCTMMT